MSKTGYIPKEERKKILLLCDDINLFSGVATIAREIVYGTSHQFNWVNLGGAINHPKHGQRLDLSEQTNNVTGNNDSSVILYAQNGYGDVRTLRRIIKQESPDAIMLFTDPRYWVWVFEIENEIRKKLPIIYYNIWDSTPIPLWNKSYYNSCDTLLAISKQTYNINKLVLDKDSQNKIIEYIPHGIDENKFFPINDSIIKNLTKKEFLGHEPKFVAFFNSRNIRRKSVPDLLLAWKLFYDKLSDKQKEDVALLLHTDPIDNSGTDLFAVKEALFGEDGGKVFFSANKLGTEKINALYNIADVTILPSSNEGWGLSLTESLMAGTMIIANVTGGMQDQMRFEDDEGNWIEFSDEFLSNHYGTYKKCGEWAIPVFPSNLSMIGSVQTPYIFDDKLDFRDLCKAIEDVYNMSPKDRKNRGLEGREWVRSQESGMSSKEMCNRMFNSISKTINGFTPQPDLVLTKYEPIPAKQLKHPIIY